MVGEVTKSLLFRLPPSPFCFGLIFKFVPDVPIDWRGCRHRRVGDGHSVHDRESSAGHSTWRRRRVGSTYGAAGSLVALVVWVYYSAQIFFFGAVFTRVYANYYGSRSAPYPRKPRL